MSEMTVSDDMVVSRDYELRLDDGQVVDSSQGKDPLQFIQGQGQIISGLEEELYGMEVGEQKEVSVEPASGYGERREDQLRGVPLAAFPADMELQEGMAVQTQDTSSGQSYQAIVREIGDEQVVLDFNHPLAGETLHFEVRIADLRQATDEELAHKHVH